MSTKTRYNATVPRVEDGDTFVTAGGNWIRLANVCAPETGQSGAALAKQRLEALILHKEIVYEPVGTSYGRIVAEVWVSNTYVNGTMRNYGYKC